MQINLQIHIHLDGVDLDSYLTRLALLFAPPSGSGRSPQTAPEAFEGPETHAPLPTAQGTPVLPATEAMGADADAPIGEWVTVTVAPNGHKPKTPVTKRPAILPGETQLPEVGRLPFAQFDELCRAEMKRLSMDKRMPNYSLWNSERDVRLPTMAGVLSRYGVTNLPDLAEKLGMLPPLSATGARVTL